MNIRTRKYYGMSTIYTLGWYENSLKICEMIQMISYDWTTLDFLIYSNRDQFLKVNNINNMLMAEPKNFWHF